MVDIGAIRSMGKKAAKSAQEGAMKVFHKADELGGEVRDFLNEKVWQDERVQKIKGQISSKLGRDEDKQETATEE